MSATPVLDGHRNRLLARFAEELAARDPGRVLDVGCGRGTLLRELAQRGVAGEGVEENSTRAEEARGSGLVIHAGTAYELPFEDGAFGTVVIRHVLHHLADPAAAVAEAWRVGRTSIVLAEPRSDRSFATQAAMAELDAFTSELLERGGHVHRDPLSAGELVALAPAPPAGVETRAWGRTVLAPAAEVAALISAAAGEEPLTATDLVRRSAFLGRAEAGELSYNGSLAVFLARKPAP